MRIIKTIIATLMIAGFLWGFGSWIEIVSKNSQPNPSYSKVNAFVLLLDKGV